MADTPAASEPVEQTTPTESAPVETKQVVDEQAIADKQVADSLAKEDTVAKDSEDITPPEPKAEETPEEQPPKGYEQRKEQLTGDITSLVAQRNQLRTEVEKLNAEVYQPATEQELQDQGLSPEMAAIEAFKQDQALRDYNNQVAEKQLELRDSAQRVVRDFPELSPVLQNGETNPEYNKELGDQLDAVLGQNLQTDPNTGQVVGSSIDPYLIYKLVADAQKASSEAGQLKGQQATERMLASVDSPSGAAPVQDNKKDDFLQGLLGAKLNQRKIT